MITKKAIETTELAEITTKLEIVTMRREMRAEHLRRYGTVIKREPGMDIPQPFDQEVVVIDEEDNLMDFIANFTATPVTTPYSQEETE